MPDTSKVRPAIRVRTAGRDVHTAARCEEKCGFWGAYSPDVMGIERTAWSAAELRKQARDHVRATGHQVTVTVTEVTVTVTDETCYEPEASNA